MARLKSHGHEVLRYSKEREVVGDELVDWERVTTAYMSDGKVLQKRDCRFKDRVSGPYKHTWGWKIHGKLKPGAVLHGLRDKAKAAGYLIEVDLVGPTPMPTKVCECCDKDVPEDETHVHGESGMRVCEACSTPRY